MEKKNPTSQARQIRSRKRAEKWRQSVRIPTGYVTKFSMTGGKLKCPSDPPSLNTAPWNTVVVQKAVKVGETNTTGLIDCTDLCYWLIDQLGIPVKYGSTWYINYVQPCFNIRINQMKAWNLTGRTIGLQPYDYTTTGNMDELGGWMDSGTTSDLPAVGYQWPLTCKQHTVTVQLTKNPPATGDDITEGRKKVCTLLGNSGDTIIAHFHLDWRFPPVTAGTLSELRTVYDMTRRIAADARQVHGLTRQTKQKLDEIYQAMPSKTVLGAAHVFIDGAVPVLDDGDSASVTSEFLRVGDTEELVSRISEMVIQRLGKGIGESTPKSDDAQV